MKRSIEQFEFNLGILGIGDAVIKELNRKYGIGREVKAHDGNDYVIHGPWQKEKDLYGAWARSEKLNRTIWITHGEIMA